MLRGQLFRLTRGHPAALAPVNLAVPTIAGIPTQGQVQTGTPGTWEGSPTIAYQWLADDVPIGGATTLNFTPTVAEIGTTLALSETASNSSGSTTVFSLPTAPIASDNPETPVLASGVSCPIGRATKIGAGSVPLDSDTLGLLTSSGTSAITGWQIRQTGGAAQWKTPDGTTIGASFIATTGTPVPLAALTAGDTATFEVKATNSSGPGNTVTLTHAVQSGADARPGYSVSSQTQITAVCPTTGTFTNLSDAELWLPRGVKYWETAQLLLRRIRCTSGHIGYVRPADLTNPPWVRDVKAVGFTNLDVEDLRARYDSNNTYLFWSTPDGSTYSSGNISFRRCFAGAVTPTLDNTLLPSGFRFDSTVGGSVDDAVCNWINGFVTASTTGSTFTTCSGITVRRGFVRNFRNNGIFRGGAGSSHVVDSINSEDCIYLAPTQVSAALHMDGMQDTGTGTAGTVSNCYDDRPICIVGEGVGVLQGRFGRTDLGNTHTNIGVRNPIFTISAYWGFAFGVGDGVLAERGLFFFDPNCYTAGGALRGNGYVTMVTATGRVGFTNATAGDSGWGNVVIDNCLIQDYQAGLIPTGATFTDNRGFASAALDTLTSDFSDPAGFDKAGDGWAAFTTYAAVRDEVIRCLKPIEDGPCKNGDGTYQGPLFPDGSWNDGTVYP